MTNIVIQRELKFWIDAALDDQDEILSERQFTAFDLLTHLEGRGIAIRTRCGDAVAWRFCATMRCREHEVVDICLRFVAENVLSR